MPTPNMTEDEIVSYIGKTNLPTILVEGKDDARIYRWLENQLGIFGGSILICAGREVLLSIFRKRATFPHAKLAWLADLDMWCYSSPPPDLADIVFTTGYSIENDLYAGSEIESLMEEAERSRHARLVVIACQWFAFEIQEFQAGRAATWATHDKEVIDTHAMGISRAFIAKRGYASPDVTIVDRLVADYKLSLRGKTLLQVIVMVLSDSNRNPKYGYGAIVEMCLKLYSNNPHIQRIVSEVKARLTD
jgi:hypothetical protein